MPAPPSLATTSYQRICSYGIADDALNLLNERAAEVGQKIGWALEFVVAQNPEYVGLAAGHDRVIIAGPAKLADLAAHDIDLDLEALERHDKTIVTDEDGDPRLV